MKAVGVGVALFSRGQRFSLLLSEREDWLGQRCAVIGEGDGVGIVNDGRAFLECVELNRL